MRLAYYGKANWFLILGDCCGHTMLEDKLVFDIMVAKPYGLLCLKGFFFLFFSQRLGNNVRGLGKCMSGSKNNFGRIVS